jgi:hypothetical protein
VITIYERIGEKARGSLDFSRGYMTVEYCVRIGISPNMLTRFNTCCPESADLFSVEMCVGSRGSAARQFLADLQSALQPTTQMKATARFCPPRLSSTGSLTER